MAAIPFPSNPLPYVSTPWVDASGIAWLWAVRGDSGKWGRAPTGGITSPYTISETTPEDTTKFWVDPTDSSVATWDPDNLVWVEIRGAQGIEGPEGTSAASTVTAITGSYTVTVPSDGKDHFRKLVPSGTGFFVNLNLPPAVFARDCQVVTVFSTLSLAVINPVAGSGTTLNGEAISPTVANVPYSFIYTASDAKWNALQ